MLSRLTQAIILVALLISISHYGHSETDNYESAPILAASKILSPTILNSPDYTIQEQVYNDSYMNNFTVNSNFGVFFATGEMQLENLVHEIKVLKEIEQKYPSQSVAQDAALATGKKIIVAPVHAVEKVVDTVSDPNALKKTITAVPRGVTNLFKFAASTVEAGVDLVSNTNTDTSKSAQKSDSTSVKLNDVTDYVSDKALDLTGYNQAATALMKEYALDPYTQNQRIRSEIRRVAGIQSGVGIAGRFIPSVATISGVGSFNHYVDMAGSVAAYEDPKKLEALNTKVLDAIGKNDQQKASWDDSFKNNQSYTPLTRAILLNNLKLLGDIRGRAGFIQMASNAQDSETAQFYVTASHKLLKLHQQQEALKELVTDVKLPAALSKSNKLYIPLPVDHVVWTKEIAQIFRNFKSRIVQKYKVSSTTVILSGTISPRCSQELKILGADSVLVNQRF